MPETGSPHARKLESTVLESTVLESTTLPLPGDRVPALSGCSLEPAELVAGNYQAVYRYAFRLSGCVASAEDITQETFLQALKHLTQLRCDQAQRSWLLAIARRSFLRKATRAQSRREQSLDAPNAQIELALGDAAEVPDVAQQLENRDAVQAALDQLGPDARLVVVMYYFEELSYNEIANQLQIPIGTVMSRLNRSREALRRVLEAAEVNAAASSAKAKESRRHG